MLVKNFLLSHIDICPLISNCTLFFFPSWNSIKVTNFKCELRFKLDIGSMFWFFSFDRRTLAKRSIGTTRNCSIAAPWRTSSRRATRRCTGSSWRSWGPGCPSGPPTFPRTRKSSRLTEWGQRLIRLRNMMAMFDSFFERPVVAGSRGEGTFFVSSGFGFFFFLIFSPFHGLFFVLFLPWARACWGGVDFRSRCVFREILVSKSVWEIRDGQEVEV